MVIPKTISQIMAESPFPWREVMRHGNTVFMLDAAGKEVPMFSITALAEQLTHHMAASAATKAQPKEERNDTNTGS